MRELFFATTVLFTSILLAPLGIGQIAQADTQVSDTKPKQWRLVWNSNPATTATLCWNTTNAGSEHRVFIRQAGSTDQRTVVAQRNAPYTTQDPKLFFHHAQLKDLLPSTKYHVIMESDGQASPEFYFLTAPAEDVPVAILFGADSRSGQEARRKMNRMLARLLRESQQPERVPILALAHGGDFVYDGRKLKLWSQWMEDHELTVSDDGQLLPIIPSRGNHDGGKMFNEVFAFPPEDKNFYGINLSPQVRLLTLNTETSLAGDQRNWLDTDLAKSRTKYRWLLAQYHRPAFPAVKVPWLNLIHWVPLFEKYHLDIACEGDGHNIKRTPPIRDSKFDSQGVVYVGEGGLGVGQRTPKTNRWYLNSTEAKTGQGHHVQLLQFGKEQLTCHVVLLGGKIFDKHSIGVRNTVADKTPPVRIQPAATASGS